MGGIRLCRAPTIMTMSSSRFAWLIGTEDCKNRKFLILPITLSTWILTCARFLRTQHLLKIIAFSLWWMMASSKLHQELPPLKPKTHDLLTLRHHEAACPYIQTEGLFPCLIPFHPILSKGSLLLQTALSRSDTLWCCYACSYSMSKSWLSDCVADQWIFRNSQLLRLLFHMWV